MPGPKGPCTLQVDTSGHQALQLHSRGVVLFSIGVVEGDSSPASKGGSGGLGHPQFLTSLRGKRTHRKGMQSQLLLTQGLKIEMQT